MRYALGQDSRQTNHQVIKIADESVECNLSFSCKNEQKAFYKIIKDWFRLNCLRHGATTQPYILTLNNPYPA